MSHQHSIPQLMTYHFPAFLYFHHLPACYNVLNLSLRAGWCFLLFVHTASSLARVPFTRVLHKRDINATGLPLGLGCFPEIMNFWDNIG